MHARIYITLIYIYNYISNYLGKSYPPISALFVLILFFDHGFDYIDHITSFYTPCIPEHKLYNRNNVFTRSQVFTKSMLV